MLNILRYEKIFCETDESIASKIDPLSDVIYLGVHSESIFSFMGYFFSPENCVSFDLLVSLITELISLDTSCKPTVGFFLKITSFLNNIVNLT